MVKERAKNFINEIGLPVTRFAKCVDLSADAIRKWLSGELNLKESNIDRIDKWLRKFNR
ncbi:MAG: hypothetical protein IKO36_02575 [Bacteroidaceae bacterium]|nr:hypothetical protein [Bacteroidaceae bacterium]